MIGPERKSRLLNKKEKKITAYHEVGHATVGHLLPNCDPVHKISIISRGMALGVTWFLPEEDKHLYSKSKFEDELCSLLGGYTAEEVFFGEMTTGASNDLEKATKIAHNMVTKYGMSELGPIIFGQNQEEIFLGKDYGHKRNYSETSASEIDKLVKAILNKAHKQTKEIITTHKKLIEQIAEDLIKVESMNSEVFKTYFKNIKVPKKSNNEKKSNKN